MGSVVDIRDRLAASRKDGRIDFGALATAVGCARLDLSSEGAAQAGLETFLKACVPLGCEVSREHRLGPDDRIDFLVDGRWGVEMKARGAQPRPTLRQLERYAEHAAVEGLILATGKAVLMPAMVGDKPLRVVNLGRAWL